MVDAQAMVLFKVGYHFLDHAAGAGVVRLLHFHDLKAAAERFVALEVLAVLV